jgi:D-threo-aldose 1-dehydrogenase
VGAKDWRVIRAIAEVVDLDWVMFACSLTVYTHPPELLEFCATVDAVNFAVGWCTSVTRISRSNTKQNVS